MITRREFIIHSANASGSLLLMGALPSCKSTSPFEGAVVEDQSLRTLYLEVSPQNTFFLTFDKTEMGQGVITGQATMFGEEADIHPSSFIMRPAPADSRYGTPSHMVTGGSTSTSQRFELLRKVGASYRQSVRQAAASAWGVLVTDIDTDNGYVYHKATKKKAPYAAFNRDVAGLDPNNDPSLKEPKDFKYIGKFNDRVEAREKSTGTPEYGIDFSLPGMKTAIVVRAPTYGAKLKSFDQEAIRKLGAVRDLVPLSSGLAIVCDRYWQCLTIRKRIKPNMLVWDSQNAVSHTTEQLFETYKKEAHLDPAALEEGEVLVESEYSLPFLNHAPMEPQNAVGRKDQSKLELWIPTQGPTFIQAYAEKVSSYKLEQIKVNTSKYLGGGFGRRAYLDYGIEIIELTLKLDYPIKLMWSREDDMRHSPLRPMSVHRLQAVVDSKKPTEAVKTWQHKIAAESILQQISNDVFPLLMPSWISSMVGGALSLGGINFFAEEGAQQPYSLPYDISSVEQKSSVPVAFWRAVGSSHNGFVVESFTDEVANALGDDPVQFRLKLLQEEPRATEVIKKAAELSNWLAYPKGGKKALGFAYHFSFKTHCAEVAEVEIIEGKIRVHKVYAVVDCGLTVNPDVVRQQVESGIIFGLTAALHGKIEFKDGKVIQSNFDDYPLLRLSETPEIDVHLMDSKEKPTGIGEPGLPPIAAAVGNGLFRLTGKRHRSLPFKVI